MKTRSWIDVTLLAAVVTLSVLHTFCCHGAIYYVNNGYTANDEWCTAPGNDANLGTSPGSPKATVKAILDYDLGPGDVVRIDTGDYDLTAPANITVSRSLSE